MLPEPPANVPANAGTPGHWMARARESLERYPFDVQAFKNAKIFAGKSKQVQARGPFGPLTETRTRLVDEFRTRVRELEQVKIQRKRMLHVLRAEDYEVMLGTRSHMKSRKRFTTTRTPGSNPPQIKPASG